MRPCKGKKMAHRGQAMCKTCSFTGKRRTEGWLRLELPFLLSGRPAASLLSAPTLRMRREKGQCPHWTRCEVIADPLKHQPPVLKALLAWGCRITLSAQDSFVNQEQLRLRMVILRRKPCLRTKELETGLVKEEENFPNKRS